MKNVHFLRSIPSLKKVLFFASKDSKKVLIFCDVKLKSHIKVWNKEKRVAFYFLNSNEKSKSVEELGKHLKKITSLTRGFNQKELVFIAIGGGSLLDLVGFLSSIYKRGVPFISVPSTYLAVLDSAHGGKNALNFSDVKNVVGTYYFPKAILIIESFFHSLSQKQKKSAYGELLKISLIDGKTIYKNLKRNKFNFSETFLKQAILSKLKIVQKDPYELKSERKKLNLGHTLGHILEPLLKIPHGEAVLIGIFFSLNWSASRNIINEKHFLEIQSLIPKFKIRSISLVQFKKYLRQDKKYRNSAHIDFIFIKQPGEVIIKKVSENEIVKEAKRQGFIKK